MTAFADKFSCNTISAGPLFSSQVIHQVRRWDLSPKETRSLLGATCQTPDDGGVKRENRLGQTVNAALMQQVVAVEGMCASHDSFSDALEGTPSPTAASSLN